MNIMLNIFQHTDDYSERRQKYNNTNTVINPTSSKSPDFPGMSHAQDHPKPTQINAETPKRPSAALCGMPFPKLQSPVCKIMHKTQSLLLRNLLLNLQRNNPASIHNDLFIKSRTSIPVL